MSNYDTNYMNMNNSEYNPTSTGYSNPTSTGYSNPTTTGSIPYTTQPVINDITQLLPNLSSETIVSLLNSGVDLMKLYSDKNYMSEKGMNFDSEMKSPSTNIYQKNFSGTSNVYSPYLYYNKNGNDNELPEDMNYGLGATTTTRPMTTMGNTTTTRPMTTMGNTTTTRPITTMATTTTKAPTTTMATTTTKAPTTTMATTTTKAPTTTMATTTTKAPTTTTTPTESINEITKVRLVAKPGEYINIFGVLIYDSNGKIINTKLNNVSSSSSNNSHKYEYPINLAIDNPNRKINNNDILLGNKKDSDGNILPLPDGWNVYKNSYELWRYFYHSENTTLNGEWWEYKFDNPVNISYIEIFGRTACCPERNKLRIDLYNNNTNIKWTTSITEIKSDSHYIIQTKPNTT